MIGGLLHSPLLFVCSTSPLSPPHPHIFFISSVFHQLFPLVMFLPLLHLSRLYPFPLRYLTIPPPRLPLFIPSLSHLPALPLAWLFHLHIFPVPFPFFNFYQLFPLSWPFALHVFPFSIPLFFYLQALYTRLIIPPPHLPFFITFFFIFYELFQLLDHSTSPPSLFSTSLFTIYKLFSLVWSFHLPIFPF